MDFVTKALLKIDCAAGQFLLEGVDSLDIEAAHGLKPVKTMNRLNRVRGHRGGPTEVTGTISIPIEIVKEAPLFALWKSREVCLASFEEGPGDGDRFQLPGFQIDSIKDDYNAEGEATLEVGFVAVDLIQIPD